jgi:chondroitin AC lyase
MKISTTSLLVNRLLTSLFTLPFLFFAGNAVALTDGQAKLNSGEPITGNTTINSGVEYASLTANATEKAVFINWVTASEQNNSHFEVERSLDMKDFKTVAIVLDGFVANGTGKSYKFKEDAGEIRNGKTVYYRLKQIDTDNRVHYSTVMAVQMNTAASVFPTQEAANLNSTDTYSNPAVIADIQIIYPGSQILLSKQSSLSICSTNIPVGRVI